MTQNQSIPEASTEFKNDHMHVSVQRLPGSQVRLDITVLPEATEASYKQAVKSVNKEISLPGFRKGKAPDEVVIKKYEGPIHQEWRDIIVRTGFNDALKLVNLQPFSNDSVRCLEFKDHPRDQPAKFVIQFEAGPLVPHINVKDIKLPKLQDAPITQKDVDQVVKNLRLYHAKWEDITDRPIKAGDYADLDIENLDEGITICKDTRFEVVPGTMANWMCKMLIGAKLNESVEGISEKEDRPNKTEEEEEIDKEFKPTKCRITVKTIKNPILPELNEEFTKKTGTKDFAELEQRIREDLVRRGEEKKGQKLIRLLDEQLLDKYKFDVPNSIVSAEVNQRMMAQKEWMEKQNAPAQEAKKIMDDMVLKLPSEVEKGCRLLFLLLGFAQEHNLSVTQDEIISELSQQVAYGQASLGDMKDPNAVRARITQGLILRKAKAYIVEQALQH